VFKAWLRELPEPLLTHDLFIELTDLVEGLVARWIEELEGHGAC